MALNRLTQFSWVHELYGMARRCGASNDRGVIYQSILEHIVQGFEGKSGSLALCDDEMKTLTIVAGIDLPAGVVGSSQAIGSNIMGRVVSDAQPVLLNGDVSGDARFKRSERDGKNRTPSSAMCWPLKIEDRVIGALSINRAAELPPFEKSDLDQGSVVLNLVGLVLDNLRLNLDQQQRIAEQQALIAKLEQAQSQLLQSDKMASIGQLAAGIAHEINNPIGFVYSNLGTLEKYLVDLFSVLNAYEQAQGDPAKLAEVEALKKEIDMGYLNEDVPALMHESSDGIARVKKIVQDLKDFSHVDNSDEWQWSDLHKGLDSTLNIVSNEIKYKADVKKEYGQIPEIECLPSQLNQVFMNLLVNAAHAIEEHGTITLRSGVEGDQVWIEINDTGKGIPAENMNRIFDPFFTTKAVGKGTGLGLSLSYGIICKHKGTITVKSEVGVGTTFRVCLPIHQQM